MVGIGGGLLGFGLTVGGLAFERAVLREDYARLIGLNADAAIAAVGLALAAMVVAALIPGWDASRRQPAWQLKAQ
jgi:putative ABC transport system permease protein